MYIYFEKIGLKAIGNGGFAGNKLDD